MKSKISNYLIILAVCGILLIILFIIFSASLKINSAVNVSEPKNDIPYSKTDYPDNYSVIVNFNVDKAVFISFNALDNQTSVILFENNISKQDILNLGYEVNTVITASYDFLSELIDRFGGINLKNNGSVFNCTGVQITDMLSRTNDKSIRYSIIKTLFNSIKEKGISADDMLYIIENTQTTLSYPEAYHLPDTLNYALNSIVFVN